MKKYWTSAALLAALGVSIPGCSDGRSALEAPDVSPSGAASEAMTMYDKDGDGFIAGAELDAASGIKAAMGTIDANKDEKASEDEIAARIESWSTSGVALTTCLAKVSLDGRPLAGAIVTFEPEPFLGDSFKAASGETNALGEVMPSIPKEQRMPADAPPGLALGLYKVRITKDAGGRESLPAKFNAETTLGQQIAPDDPAVAKQRVLFELKS
jgi:hypothetical protein